MDRGLFAVADGVGGAQAGDVASEMAVEILGEAFINLDEDGDAEDRMRLAIDKANAAIYQMSRDLPSLSTMATTLVAIHISGNIATIGHVGDSRLYRLDSDGLLFRETQDHSIVEEEVRAGRMTRDQAATHPSRNVISRALGADASVEIDMKTIMFETNSMFLVCSDGVTRHIGDEELRDLLSIGSDPEKICAEIKRICFKRGAEDNLTAVVVKAGAAAVTPPPAARIEEEAETVATARAGASAGAVFPDLAENARNLDTVVDDDFELDDIEDLEDIDDTEEIVIPTREEAATRPPVRAAVKPVKNEPEIKSLDTLQDVRAYRVDENSGGGVLGRLLSGLVWLLVGLLIGALGYFLYSTSFGGTTVEPATQSNKAVLLLEQQRRLVDADPAKFIAAYSTNPDATAGDNYMIGRAYLIQGNYGAAKTSFEKALNQMEGADVSNRAILEHDIKAGLSIAVNEDAQKSFESGPDKPETDAGEATPEPRGD